MELEGKLKLSPGEKRKITAVISYMEGEVESLTDTGEDHAQRMRGKALQEGCDLIDKLVDLSA